MLYSFKELKRLGNLDNQSVEDVVNAINSIGFEVEETIPFGNVEGIKFGKVLKTYENENSTKLTVAEIEFDDVKRTIQTTATNVFEGMYVVAFVPGSKLGDIVLGEKEMAGITSQGMLSSLNEIGADEELIRNNNGIQSYPAVDLSLDPVEVLDLQDTIIDVDVLSNRSDANSYYVMARELAAYFGTKVNLPIAKEANKESTITVENGRADALVMMEADARVTISIREQLLLAKNGIKSIDNMVDLTNLTLIMTGQPTHAYDKARVGNSFNVKLTSGKVKLFGGKEVELEDNLVIEADGEPVSLAGVMGFSETGVQRDTKEVILELGRFNIKDVRTSLKTIKIDSKAGVQSSKNLGLGTIELAYAYLASKLDGFSKPVNLHTKGMLEVSFNVRKVSTLAGFDIASTAKYNQAIESLEALGFKFLVDKVKVPSYRHDVTHQQDLNEEIFRFYGYDNFKPEAPKGVSASVVEIKHLAPMIASQGYNEVTTYSLISRVKNVVNPFELDKIVSLETFVSKEREEIRSSQAVSLLEIIEYNQKRKLTNVSIFSEGMIGDGRKSVALASTTKSFKEMQTDVINIINKVVTFERTSNETLHPGVSALIMSEGKQIGWIGKVHPSLTRVNAFMAEFIQDKGESKVVFEDYSNVPLKTRDITFELAKGEELDSKLPKVEVYERKVIDRFEKDGIRKVTVRFTAGDATIKKLENR